MKFRLSQSAGQWLQPSIALFSLISVLTLSMTVLREMPTQAQPSVSSPTLLKQQPGTRQKAATRLPSGVRKAVLQAHARHVRVPVKQLRIVSFSRESWSDTCLGLGRPEEGCGLAMVNGWRVEVGHNTARWFYRTDNTGQAVRLEEIENIGSFPQAVAQKVLAFASKELKIPVSQLTIVTGRSQVWDGCLGVSGPNEACTRIGIPGWQVILTGAQQYWVYHLDQQGSLIKRNPTTSGRGTIVPSYWQPDANMVANPEEVIFQSVKSGGIAGQAHQTVLRRDGQVLRTDLQQPASKVPVLVRKLTPQQVQAFAQTVDQNEFGDFLGFNYVSPVGADYFTISLIAPGRQQGTQYMDIAQDQTPAKLQQIIQAWNRIATPDRR